MKGMSAEKNERMITAYIEQQKKVRPKDIFKVSGEPDE